MHALQRNCEGVARTRQPRNGFTLIELMIVVAILGILAAIAIPVFNRYIRSTKTSEVVGMFHHIRLKQEQYRGFFGTYCEVPDWHPARVGAHETDWEPAPELWKTLGVRPQKKSVYYQYRIIAGEAGESDGVAEQAEIDTTRAWWYVQARGDLDEDGELSFFELTSQREEIYKENETE